jgi:hypothetical protein
MRIGPTLTGKRSNRIGKRTMGTISGPNIQTGWRTSQDMKNTEAGMSQTGASQKETGASQKIIVNTQVVNTQITAVTQEVIIQTPATTLEVNPTEKTL